MTYRAKVCLRKRNDTKVKEFWKSSLENFLSLFVLNLTILVWLMSVMTWKVVSGKILTLCVCLFFASIQVEICHDFLVQCLKLSIKLALPKLPAYGRSREDRHPYVMCLIWMNVVLHKNELLKITSQMMMLSLWGCYLKHWGGLPGNFRMLPTSTSFQTMQIEE